MRSLRINLHSWSGIIPMNRDFLWPATEFGLACFDGFKFQTFRQDTGSLLNNQIIYFLPFGPTHEYIGVTGNNTTIGLPNQYFVDDPANTSTDLAKFPIERVGTAYLLVSNNNNFTSGALEVPMTCYH